MLKRCLAIIAVLASALAASAQQEPAFTHYWLLEPAYNPAAAGKSEQLNIGIAYNMQLTGYDNAPKTMYAGADIQLAMGRTRHGVGAHFMNDNIGLFAHQRFVVQYNYKVPLFGGVLSLGVQGDMLSETFKGSGAETSDASDPAIPTTDVSGSKFDASAGIYFNHRRWYAGVSALHLTEPTVTLGETYQYSVARTYFFTAGYNIKLNNPFITIHPSVLGMYDGTDWLANVSARLEYNYEQRHLFVGGTYGIDRSAALFVGGKFMGVVLTYSYEAYTSGVGLKNGAHEIVVGYQMDIDLGKKGKNRHKSVRLL